MLDEDDIYSKIPDIFNIKNYIAKTPAQHPDFLKQYPTFDGRGIKIGIIDSCIDVSLPGLQKTSEGLPKIIDCFDLTGNGYVNTSTVKKLDKNSKCLIGLTGRQLKISSTWKNPSGKWHLGIKSIYELCDEEALSKITDLRKKQIKEQNEMLKNSVDKIVDKEDHDFMLQYLDATEELSKDSLVADCIVWFNGSQWQACVDTSFMGDLQCIKVLTNYRDCHEFGMFFNELVYCLSIRENGNLLEIYVTYTDHGTVIANIAAGYYPHEPEKNGFAPGAQIISFAVLDPKNYDIPVERNLVQAFQKCIEFDVDIINISVSSFPKGEYELVKEMAEKHGIIILRAAGNDGPILSSIYEMERFPNILFYIGSCLTSEMKRILYKADDAQSSSLNVTLFSSQGPMPKSGGCGVTFVAPGHGAVDQPRHYPYKTRVFAATSYACPNALGAIACVISGLKALSISVMFFKLKLALINTAFLPKNGSKLAFGHGIIQIKDAFEFYLKNLQNFPVEITNITVSLFTRKKLLRMLYSDDYQNGIFLKVVDKKILKYSYNVKIEINNNSTVDSLFKIDWHLKLSSNSENLITFASAVDQNNEFFVEVNITNLNPNSINYAEIVGYDSSNLSWGPLFHLPITVIIPKDFYETEKINEVIELNSTFPHRLFIPLLSSEISGIFIRLTALDELKSEVTLLVQINYGEEEMEPEDTKELNFTANHDQKKCDFEVYDNNKIHEICLIRTNRINENNVKFQFELCFVGKPSLLSTIASFVSSFFKQPEDDEDEETYLSVHNDTLNEEFENCSNQSSSTDSYDSLITYKLISQKVNYKNVEKKKFFITTYYFTVKYEKAWCLFDIIMPNDELFRMSIKPYKTRRIQIFTLSKKFIAGYCTTFTDYILLHPGTYIVKASFEYHDDTILQAIFPFTFVLPFITLTTYDYTMLTALCLNRCNVPIVYAKSMADQIRSFFPYFVDIKKHLNNVNPNDAQLWLNNIQKYYCNFDLQNLKKAADLLLQKTMAKQFLRNYDKIIKDENFLQNEIITFRKFLILDALFYKADSILNEYLKQGENVPEIFKNNFGFDLITYDFESRQKKLHPSIFDILWSIFTYNLYPKQVVSKRPPYQKNNVNSSNVMLSKNGKSINRKTIKQVTSLFLQYADDSDIRKTLIIIKKALIFGNFGTALFYLNKTSTENQTLPNYKLFDEAIVQLLKHPTWNHLAEAHENALLHRHRNYYRIF